MILDVGCGHKPCGDVNCDLYPKATVHRIRIDLDTKHIPNFVLCDAQYLPFRDASFELVNCSHLIEHVEKPFLLLQELIRVSQESVVVRCPHRYARSAKGHGHRNFFNVKWFGVALERIKRKVPLFYECESGFYGNPLRGLLEIRVKVRKIVQF